MSGSIGGKRIKRAEVQPTLDNYIEKVSIKEWEPITKE